MKVVRGKFMNWDVCNKSPVKFRERVQERSKQKSKAENSTSSEGERIQETTVIIKIEKISCLI